MGIKDYKKKRAAAQADTVIDVTLPSGFVWKMREPPIQQFLLSGKLPRAFTSKLASIAKKNNDGGGDVIQEMSAEDLIASLEFGRDLLLACSVDPKIVVKADPDSDDEIAPEDIDPTDFQFLLNWVLSGGKSGESLGTFPLK